MSENKENIIKYFIYALMALLFVFLFTKEYIIAPDTPSYLSSIITRSPLYPLFLKSFKLIAGEHYYLNVVAYTQILLGFFSVFLLTRTFQSYFKTSEWIRGGISFFLLSPYFSYGLIGNNILTEGLAYPLFLSACAFLIRALLEKSPYYIILCSILIMLLILTRAQFLFFVPFLLVIFFYALTVGKKFYTRNYKILLGLCSAATLLAPNLLERSYNRYMHGEFITIPFVGIQLIALPLYVARESDEKLFSDPLEKKIFQDTHKKMRVDKVTLDEYSKTQPSFLNSIWHYASSYNVIVWRALEPTLANVGVTDPRAINTILIMMAFSLMKANAIDYILMYIKNFVYPYGWYLGTVLLFILIGSMISLWRFKDKYSLLTFLSISLAFANTGLIALVEPTIARYTIYTDALLASCLLIILVRVLNLNATINSVRT